MVVAKWFWPPHLVHFTPHTGHLPFSKGCALLKNVHVFAFTMVLFLDLSSWQLDDLSFTAWMSSFWVTEIVFNCKFVASEFMKRLIHLDRVRLHCVERRVWHNSLLCLWLLQRTRWWCIRRHFCVSYGYRMIWTVLCVTGSGMPWILYPISLPPCFKISLINCFIKIHCDKTYRCNSIPVQLIIDRNHVHVTICSCATKIFSRGNARVEILASFFFLYGHKSQLSPHHACATFWLNHVQHFE